MFGFLRPRRGRVREILADYVAGEDRVAELASAPASELETALASMLDVAGGEARERLTRLAVDAGVVSRWRAQAASLHRDTRRRAFSRLLRLAPAIADSALMCALMDESEAVRLEAARGLVAGGSPADAEALFALALSQPAVSRARLAEELKPRAGELAERALPEALASPEPARVLAALDFVLGWERALPLPALGALLGHPEAGVRARAVAALPYGGEFGDLEAMLLGAMGDPEPSVRAAACEAAARLAPESMRETLAACLEDTDPEVVRLAARSLASAGPAGLDLLDRRLRQSWNAGLAAAALDAVESVKAKDYGYARL
jgi:HEAT repeat protein